MSTPPIKTHAYGSSAPKPIAPLPMPTHAEYARSLAATYVRGTLSTLDEEGYPFGSVVLYVLDDRGQPVMLLSELAEHTKNIRRDGRASVLVSSTVMPGDDPMALPRVTLVVRDRSDSWRHTRAPRVTSRSATSVGGASPPTVCVSSVATGV